MPETGGFRGVSMLMLHNNVNGPFLLRRRRLTKSLLKKNVMFMLRIWCRAFEIRVLNQSNCIKDNNHRGYACISKQKIYHKIYLF